MNFQVWVKDAFTLRFNQSVAAAGAREFFILKEAKSGKQVKILVSQETAEELKISYSKDLERGMLYQFIVKRGFCGSEGSTGTGKEFTFSFDTVPAFSYTGTGPLVLYTDSRYCQLLFSNALAETDPALIKIFKVMGQNRTPLVFRLQSRHYENQVLIIRIDDELASGDRLSIQIDRNLTNIYNERLPEGLELEAEVCSSRSPHLEFSLRDKKLSMTAKSMKQASVRLLKLKPEFYTQLTNRDFGMLQQKHFKAEFIEKEILQKLTDLPEKSNNPALKDNELGSPLGFFAFLVQRYEPYNACRDIALMRLPAARPPELQVFHRRNMDMVVKAGQGQTLYWLYDNRNGKGLGKIPFFLKGYGQEARPLGESSANGVLLSDREIQESDLVTARSPDNSDMALAKLDRRPPSDREVKITVFSERDFYKPGDTVHIGGIVKEYSAGKVSSTKATSASLEIMGPDWQKVKSDTLQLDPLGGFHYEYKSDPAGKKGLYQIQVQVTDAQSWRALHNITIDYYQPNTIEVAITDMAEHYLFTDTFRPRVSGSYLAGNPMAGDAFTYTLSAYDNDDPKIFKTNGLDRYSFGLGNYLAKKDPLKQGHDKLDASGKFTLDIPMKTFKATNYLAELHFSVTGKSAEGKEFTARAKSIFFPGNLLTGMHIGRYQNLKDPVKAELALVDFQGKPASGEIRVSLYQQFYEKNQWKLKKVAGPEDIYVDKIKTHAFRVQKAGHYVLRCDTPDAERPHCFDLGQFSSPGTAAIPTRTTGCRIESDQYAPAYRRNAEMLHPFTPGGPGAGNRRKGEGARFPGHRSAEDDASGYPDQERIFPGHPRQRHRHVRRTTSPRKPPGISGSRIKARSCASDLESPGEIKPASKTKLKIRVSDSQNKEGEGKTFRLRRGRGQPFPEGLPDP